MKTILLLNIIFFICIQLTAQTKDSAEYYYKKGSDEASLKHYLVAARYFDKAIIFNSKFTDAYLQNGKANLEMRKIDAALVNFTKANELHPSHPGAIKELSTLYFNNRQFAKAINMAQQCKDCPGSDRIVAMSYYHLEDYGKAVTGLQKALEVNPSDAELLYTLGRTYIELEDEKSAIVYYRKAIEIDTAKHAWMYELALMYYNLHQYADALRYFIRAEQAGYIKTNDFYENIGFAYLYNRDFETGIKNLAIVLARKPNNVTLLSDIAQAMYGAKRYDDALTYYQKLLSLNDKDFKSLYMAGITFQKKGEKEKGQAMCDKAIAMDPSLAEKRQKKGEQFGL